MPFIKEYNKDFYFKDNSLQLSENFFKENSSKFKKITGSRFYNVLGLNKYSSPVQTWATMVNIYKEEMDPMLSRAGNIIEPKIRDYASKHLKINFISYEPYKINWDAFPENSIFGGIPDGEPIDEQGNLLYPQKPMLEIKTSSIDRLSYKKINNQMQMLLNSNGFPIVKKANAKRDEWFNDDGKMDIKNEYKIQLSLYLYLRNIEKGIFAVCFLKPEDYVNPELCDINQREIRFVEMQVKREKISPFIEKGTAWYKSHILTGISPKLTALDLEWLKENNIEIKN
ncbi:MPN551 family DNA-binding protein [Mycoplasmoides pirum]|uniref:MPN551 family DNA-binding protein n=1 Tax=Mycoplasmoides pirum TaxID=2122 RepID=UPI000488E52C|nr:YqaJ viral recombinase family protein [Mycoplasmoides pirum]